jgi:hypothetical protein
LTLDISKLSGEERRQYKTLEDLFAYSYGEEKNEQELCEGVLATVDDWKKKMGGRGGLETFVQPYLDAVRRGDKDTARNLYFFISPLFFYIHVLYELSRGEWRNATSWSGMYCERIIKNLLREYDRCYNAHNYTDLYLAQTKTKFAAKLGRTRSIFEEKKFEPTNDLCNLVEIVYNVRSTRGPHDVPPPEPLQAQISAGQCLPVYVDYLALLNLMNNDRLTSGISTFVTFFGKLTELKVSLTFGEEGAKLSIDQLITNLFREGFFKGGKRLKEVRDRLDYLSYHFQNPIISKSLGKLGTGKNAILLRKGKKGNYTYYERCPPQDVFGVSI